MQLKKPKRFVDKKFLAQVSNENCIICGHWPSDPDHITTRGAGGDDTLDNVWPLCRIHHIERHKCGILHMRDKYQECRQWLFIHGRDDILGTNGGKISENN